MIGFIAEMLSLPFMQRALAVGAIIGVIAPLIGTYLVHREMALMGNALAHIAFTGVAVGLFLGFEAGSGMPLVSALLVAIIAGLGIQYLSERKGEYGDVALAIVLSGGFALGILIISMSGGLSVSINSYLFGSIITVTDTGVGIIAVLGLVVVSVIALTHKQLLYLTFDEEGARVARINVSMYERMLIVLSALVVVGAMQILGVILVAAMLVVPVAAASQLARSFRQSIVLSIIAGELSVVAGIALSYLYNFPTGATIVLVAVLVYVILVMSKSINLR